MLANLPLDYVRTLFSNLPYIIGCKQNDDSGYKRAMAILAASLFLAFAARTGAISNGAHSQCERAIPKRKLGLGIMITLVIAPSLPANDTPLFFLLPYGWRCNKF